MATNHHHHIPRRRGVLALTIVLTVSAGLASPAAAEEASHCAIAVPDWPAGILPDDAAATGLACCPEIAVAGASLPDAAWAARSCA